MSEDITMADWILEGYLAAEFDAREHVRLSADGTSLGFRVVRGADPVFWWQVALYDQAYSMSEFVDLDEPALYWVDIYNGSVTITRHE